MLHKQPLKRGRSHSMWVVKMEEWQWGQPHMDSAPESYGVCRDSSAAYHKTEGGNPQRCIMSTTNASSCSTLLCVQAAVGSPVHSLLGSSLLLLQGTYPSVCLLGSGDHALVGHQKCKLVLSIVHTSVYNFPL